jgi:hypothetical protein
MHPRKNPKNPMASSCRLDAMDIACLFVRCPVRNTTPDEATYLKSKYLRNVLITTSSESRPMSDGSIDVGAAVCNGAQRASPDRRWWR